MEPLKKISSPRMNTLLFFLCWLAYAITYIARLNFNASIAEILTVESITKSQAGLISTGAFFSYGVGQLINGALCDRISPKWLMFTGLTVSGVINLCMSAATSVAFMTCLWCINGFAQSMTWSPIVKLFTTRMCRDRCSHAIVHISTSSATGTLLAYGMSALFIWLISWRAVFVAAAILVLAMAVLWLLGIGRVERHCRTAGIIEDDPADSNDDNASATQQDIPFNRLMAISGIFMIGIAVVMHGILKDGVTTWAPTYLTEQFKVGASISIVATMALPVINLAGGYASSYINRHLFHNEVTTSAVFFLVAIAAMLLLLTIGRVNMIVAVVLLSLITCSMMAINVLNISLIPLRFARYGRASTATGILNSFTYLGSAVSSYGIGAVSQGFGWTVTIGMWIAIAGVGGVICVLLIKKWSRFIRAEF